MLKFHYHKFLPGINTVPDVHGRERNVRANDHDLINSYRDPDHD